MHYLKDPDPQEDDLVGRVLCGKWTLLERIGRGGMSTVYSATHRNGRRVAVKVLRRALASNRRIVTRFLREGYVANKIRHPGAVAILDDDIEDENTVFLVMELLDGATLAERYGAAGRLPSLGEALDIGERLLDVLIAAHASGVVHRDIKPSNVFVTKDGAVMLLDFGIARLLESESETGATHSGATLGTPGFMAPEQARGRGNLVDARTDLWAVGALLFFLFTGRTVHEAETPNELLIASATQPARSVGALCSGLPEPVVLLVDRALSMDRDRRWQDAASMKDALERTRRDIPDGELARGIERASGVAAASTLPETNTAEPAIVSRREAADTPPLAQRQRDARRRNAWGWPLAIGAVSIAGAVAVMSRPSTVTTPLAPGTPSVERTSSTPRAGASPAATAQDEPAARPTGNIVVERSAATAPAPPVHQGPRAEGRKPAEKSPPPIAAPLAKTGAPTAPAAREQVARPAPSEEVDVLDLRR